MVSSVSQNCNVSRYGIDLSSQKYGYYRTLRGPWQKQHVQGLCVLCELLRVMFESGRGGLDGGSLVGISIDR